MTDHQCQTNWCGWGGDRNDGSVVGLLLLLLGFLSDGRLRFGLSDDHVRLELIRADRIAAHAMHAYEVLLKIHFKICKNNNLLINFT